MRVRGSIASTTLVSLVGVTLAAMISSGCSAARQEERPDIGIWPAPASLEDIEALERRAVDSGEGDLELELAKIYGSIGDWDRVVEHASRAINLGYAGVESYVVLSSAYANLGLWPNAMAAAAEAATIDRSHAGARFSLGWAYLNQLQWARAAQAFQACVASDPDYPEAQRNLGIALTAINNYPGAVSAFEKALEQNPGDDTIPDMIAELRLSLDEALQPFRDAAVANAGDWRAHAALGNQANIFGFQDEALEAYQAAASLGMSPSDPERSAQLIYNIAVVYKAKGQIDDALVMFERALLLSPNQPQTHYNVGLIHQSRGNDLKAVESFEMAVEYEKGSVVPTIALADAYLRIGHFEGARYQHDRLAEADPEQAAALMGRVLAAESHAHVSR